MKENLLTIMLVVLMAGCTLHAPQATPFADIPEQFAALPRNQEMPLAAHERWWLHFNDPQLDAIMAQGFAGNLDLEMAWARLRQAQALERREHSSQWPSLDLSASGGRSRVAGSSSGVATYQGSLAAGYELDLWQKLTQERRSFTLQRRGVDHEVKALYLTLAAQLAEAYYQVVELRDRLALNREIIASFAKTVELVEWRYQRGVAPALDLYQSRQTLLGSRAELPLLEAEEQAAQNRLAVLLGAVPGHQDFGTLTHLPDLQLSFARGLPADLITNRPDIKAAFFSLQAADAEVAVAIADRFPRFKLTANYGGQSSELHSLLNSPNIFWNLLANMTQPLVDGGRRRQEVERRQAVFDERTAFYRLTVLKAFQEVEDALVKERGMDANMEILEERRQVTAATLRQALERYQQGLADFLPVLTAQVSDTSARLALIAAQRQRLSTRIQLARALGGSWMPAEMDTHP
ncbi:MAG: efflux transporter outer membrane subunit [Desulfurivibrionaceae bacterium]|nr:efflux transporter outer membrane subunit [Desulfurivibrionaceae bacterium]